MSGARPSVCHLCCRPGPLSFEHVPPASAFNRRPVVEVPILGVMQHGLGAQPRGRINQRGAGAFTLCESCNTKTGDWYAGDFADWCHQAASVLLRSDFKPRLIYLHYIFPLRVLKQICTMAFSANTERWRENHPELERFVLDRTRRWLNGRYRVFVYYNVEGCYRFVGNQMAMVNLYQGRDVVQVTEISHPPFGYVLTADGTRPDDRLYEVTHFRRYAYDELEVAPLYPPVLPTHLPIPLDYRTREQIAEQAQRGRQSAARRQSQRQRVRG